MAIQKTIWQEMEQLASQIGIAELALKYNRYGHNYYYCSKGEIITRIKFLQKEIDKLYEIEKKRAIDNQVLKLSKHLEVNQDKLISTIKTFADAMEIDFMDAIDLVEKGTNKKNFQSSKIMSR